MPCLCLGLCFQPRDTGTSQSYPRGAKPLHLHSVGLLEPPNLLDLVHQVPTIHIFHHKIQAILKEKKQAIRTRIIRAGNLQGSETGPKVTGSSSLEFQGNTAIIPVVSMGCRGSCSCRAHED